MVSASVHVSSATASTQHHHRSTSSTANAPANKRRPAPPPLARRPTDPKAQRAKRRSGDFHKQPSTSAADDDAMSSGFSQFCATCETQIVVPSTSILYCSERCRRKDSGVSPPASPALKTPSSTTTPDVDVDIIPPLSPTVRKAPTFFGDSTARASHPDQDARGASRPEVRPAYNRESSEAARYLRQFHGERPRSARVRSNRQSAVPSLSHSPSSTSSSVPYTMISDVQRPLPSSRTLVSRSVDLVTPAAAGPADADSLETLTARAASLQLSSHRAFKDDDDIYEDMLYDDAPNSYYEKRSYGEGRTSTAQSSLKHLLESGRDRS